MATIRFRGKIETVRYAFSDEVACRRIKVPKFERRHCNMAEFRCHPKYGAYANSDLFLSILSRIKRDTFGDYLRLDRIPENVTVNTEGYLAEVTLSI